jgi:hypothetical protein
MRKFIWKLRYAIHAWRHRIEWRTAWYCASECADDETLDHFAERNPIDEANSEIAYADYVTGRKQ